MSEPNINQILVVGAGAMGSQIAMVCALAGYQVSLQDISDAMLDKARQQLGERLARNVEKGRLSAAEKVAAFSHLTFTTDLSVAQSADFVIEAVVEKLDIKRQLFAELDRLAPQHAILATNSSSFVPSQIADATARADRVCNMHFFNPALVMECVEVVRGPETSQATVEATLGLAHGLGKIPVLLNREIPGFIANRILNAARDEAIALLEGGIASVEDIDTVCRTALGYPMGPFELMDLTGIDIGYYTRQARFTESGDPADLPSRSVAEKVERGELGRKTGKGWYEYDARGNRVARPVRREEMA